MKRRSISVDELKTIASANTGNVQIAQELIKYIQTNPDRASEALVSKIRTLTENVRRIDDALNKAS